MNRSIFIILLLGLTHTSILAQKDSIRYWKTDGIGSLSINQNSFSNWAKGGENNFAISSLFKFNLNYDNNGLEFENSLDLAYGILKTEEQNLRKNEDLIDFSSKIGFKALKKVFYTFMMNFKTQFADGFEYPNDSVIVSRFFAPAYFHIAVGMDYKPNKDLSLFFSPATGKYTFVNDQDLANKGSYGVTKAVYDTAGNMISKGKKFRPEFGTFMKIRYKKDVYKNTSLESKIDLYNNYTDKNKENRKNIDINWESNVHIKINRIIGINLFAHLIYDDDIDVPIYKKINGIKTETGKGPRTQFKQVFGIGISYKLSEKK
jgi:hypothetical protein